MLPVAARSRRHGSRLCISIDPEEFGELEMSFQGASETAGWSVHFLRYQDFFFFSFFLMTSHVGDINGKSGRPNSPGLFQKGVLPMLQTSIGVKTAVGGAANLTLMQTSASYMMYNVYHPACGAKKHVFSVFQFTQYDSVHVSRHLEYII